MRRRSKHETREAEMSMRTGMNVPAHYAALWIAALLLLAQALWSEAFSAESGHRSVGASSARFVADPSSVGARQTEVGARSSAQNGEVLPIAAGVSGDHGKSARRARIKPDGLRSVAEDSQPMLRHANIIRVGPTSLYRTPSQAAAVARDGDTIEIEAADYEGDVAVWLQDGLTLRGVGGRPHLRAAGRSAEGKAIWVVKGDNTVIDGIEFSGAQVSDLNGAGVRQEGRNLTVRNSLFHDNQMGILTSNDPEISILIEFSEFYGNTVDYKKWGRLGHNIYIGEVDHFVLRGSYVHGAITGHNVKSRARENIIAYNRIMDETEGASSYLLDLANGGKAYVVGNLFHQSEAADNYHMLSYASEGDKYVEKEEIYVASNTFVNDKDEGYIVLNKSGSVIKLVNNLFVGGGDYVNGPGWESGNLRTSRPYLEDQEAFDYRLTARSPAIDRGVEVDPNSGRSIVPSEVYMHPMQVAPRPKAGPLDVGAYEFAGDNPDPTPLCQDSSLYPLNLLFASCS
jgi:hypothetical protein